MNTTGEKGIIRIVGTDGHRLALAEQEFDAPEGVMPSGEVKVIIPKKAAQEIRRLLEEGGDEPLIGFTKHMVIFRKSGLVLTSRVMEGTYPNYQQVIPKENKQKILVKREDFEGALRRVSVLARDKTSAVKMTFSPTAITMFSANPDLGEAMEEIPATCPSEEFSTGFNARYFLEVLSVMEGETLSIQMEAPLSPCLVKEAENPHFSAVVMPVKV